MHMQSEGRVEMCALTLGFIDCITGRPLASGRLRRWRPTTAIMASFHAQDEPTWGVTAICKPLVNPMPGQFALACTKRIEFNENYALDAFGMIQSRIERQRLTSISLR
jgi:hypothetical protein